MKFLAFLVLLSALAIAGCAAYFSIVGLKLLFVGGGISIVVMGIALEVGKLIAATFLKQKWNEIGVLMRTYFIIATLVLMGITSVGIYGYLSAGYTTTSIAVQGYERQIAANINKIQELEKEVTSIQQKDYNDGSVALADDTRNSYIKQRLDLVAQRNLQIEKIRSGMSDYSGAASDIGMAKQALELAKSSLESDTDGELEQIKLYNARLGILDSEVQKWIDAGSGGLFRANGLDRARETRELQKAERADIDIKIQQSQDRIAVLRKKYDEQVVAYNSRVAVIEQRQNDQRASADATIRQLEQDNAATMLEIQTYNSTSDTKIADIKTASERQKEEDAKKIAEHQTTVQSILSENDRLQQNIIATDVGTFKFIAKSLNMELDTAVNYFIWMIMLVFDPLAICLILAFNVMIGKNNKAKTAEMKSVDDKPTVLETPIAKIDGESAVKEVAPPITEKLKEVLPVAPVSTEEPREVVTKKITGKLIPPVTEDTGTVHADLNKL